MAANPIPKMPAAEYLTMERESGVPKSSIPFLRRSVHGSIRKLVPLQSLGAIIHRIPISLWAALRAPIQCRMGLPLSCTSLARSRHRDVCGFEVEGVQ